MNILCPYQGNHLAVGTHKGFVQIWDTAVSKRVSVLLGHGQRVGSLAWNGDLLCSGSRDRVIIQRDVRCPASSEKKLVGHKQEVGYYLLFEKMRSFYFKHDSNYILFHNVCNQTKISVCFILNLKCCWDFKNLLDQTRVYSKLRFKFI